MEEKYLCFFYLIIILVLLFLIINKYNKSENFEYSYDFKQYIPRTNITYDINDNTGYYYEYLSRRDNTLKLVYFDKYGTILRNNPAFIQSTIEGRIILRTEGNLYNNDNIIYNILEVGDDVFSNMAFENSSSWRYRDSFKLSITGSKLKRIGNNTFKNTKLEDLYLNDSVESIGNNAFENTNMTKLYIGPSSELNTIGNNAFNGTRIKYLNIPKKITNIGTNIVGPQILLVNFEGSKPSNLSNKTFNTGNNKIIALYNDNNSTWKNTNISNLILIKRSDYNKYLNILKFTPETTPGSNSVTITGRTDPIEPATPPKSGFAKFAYELSHSIKIYDIIDYNYNGYEVKIIGESAFYNSSYINIELPKSIERIYNYAFAKSNLIVITFNTPSNLTTIGQFAFAQSMLKKIKIPDSVTEILKGAFNSSTLMEVTINKTSQLKTIEDDVFSNTKITSLELPETVRTFGIIRNIPSLKQIIFNGPKPSMPLNVVLNLGVGVKIIYKAAFDSSWRGTSIPNAIIIKQ